MTVIVDGTQLVCTDCGGTCPWDTDKYDDVMHYPGCIRIDLINDWELHRELYKVLTSNKCVKYNKSCDILTCNPFGGCCPAKYKLGNVLPKDLWRPEGTPLMCGTEQTEGCYKKYFAHHEDEVLSIVL